jgi:hypothetical protein
MVNVNGRTTGGVEWISATRLVHGRPSPTYRRGRICAVLGCSTRLSRYNPGSRCSIHDELH